MHAEEGQPRLDKLGGTTWLRTKKRVSESIEKIARDELGMVRHNDKVYRHVD